MLGRVSVYAFEQISRELELMPLVGAPRGGSRGASSSLDGWKSLSRQLRTTLAELGAAPQVDTRVVAEVLAGARPMAQSISPELDPPAGAAPEPLLAALGSDQPLTAAVRSALSPLDRHALVKVARRGASERLVEAYREIVGASAYSTHLDSRGGARMVWVSQKPATARRAVATARVSMNGGGLRAAAPGRRS